MSKPTGLIIVDVVEGLEAMQRKGKKIPFTGQEDGQMETKHTPRSKQNRAVRVTTETRR